MKKLVSFREKVTQHTSSLIHLFSRTVSIDLNKPDELTLEVYPNPVVGPFINVSISGSRNQEVELKIVDMLGKEQYSQNITLNDRVASVAIKNDHFISGIYYVIVNSGTKDRVFKKIMIQ